MVKTDLVKQYNEYENDLIRKFNQHKFYQQFPNFTKEKFTHYLLQLGHISTEFVKFIERAKLPIKSVKGKEAVRNILRDEIPAKGPTHQDNRFADLKMIGLTENQILNTSATSETKDYLIKIYDLVKYPQDNYDLKVLVILRVIGEVLVGETYKYVVKGLQKHYGMKPEKSLFYTFHWQHDQKGGTGDWGGKGHVEYYDVVLLGLIKDDEKLKIAKEAAKIAYDVRCKFHEQFID